MLTRRTTLTQRDGLGLLCNEKLFDGKQIDQETTGTDRRGTGTAQGVSGMTRQDQTAIKCETVMCVCPSFDLHLSVYLSVCLYASLCVSFCLPSPPVTLPVCRSSEVTELPVLLISGCHRHKGLRATNLASQKGPCIPTTTFVM